MQWHALFCLKCYAVFIAFHSLGLIFYEYRPIAAVKSWFSSGAISGCGLDCAVPIVLFFTFWVILFLSLFFSCIQLIFMSSPWAWFFMCILPLERDDFLMGHKIFQRRLPSTCGLIVWMQWRVLFFWSVTVFVRPPSKTILSGVLTSNLLVG